MSEHNTERGTPGFEAEVKVKFDVEELDRFFDGFAPLSDPFDLLDALLAPVQPAETVASAL